MTRLKIDIWDSFLEDDTDRADGTHDGSKTISKIMWSGLDGHQKTSSVRPQRSEFDQMRA